MSEMSEVADQREMVVCPGVSDQITGVINQGINDAITVGTPDGTSE
jgi:hypothetical protein